MELKQVGDNFIYNNNISSRDQVEGQIFPMKEQVEPHFCRERVEGCVDTLPDWGKKEGLILGGMSWFQVFQALNMQER